MCIRDRRCSRSRQTTKARRCMFFELPALRPARRIRLRWAASSGRVAKFRTTRRVSIACQVSMARIMPVPRAARSGPRGVPPRGGRKPRFALGQSRYDRPMLSLLYLVVRALARLLVGGGQQGRDDGSKDLEILVPVSYT